MATIRKLKSGNYQVQIRLSGLKAITKTFPTKTLATKFQREVEGDSKLQQSLGNPILGRLTLSKLIDDYMMQYSGKDKCVVSRLNWWYKEYGSLSLNPINQFKIREGLKKLETTNIRRGDGHIKGKTKEIEKKRSGGTINKYKANLSSVFEYAKEEYGVTENPTRGIKARKISPVVERFLTNEEQRTLLTACKNSEWDKLYLLVLMALTTGARRGELLGLKYSDIDYKNNVATLAGATNKELKQVGTKTGKSRLLPLTPIVMIELKKFREIGNALIFPNTIKNSNQPYNIKRPYATALKQANITSFRFHDLRHTAASNLAQNGANLLEIAEVLGHSNTTVTKRYAHLCIDHKRELINRVMGNLGIA